MRTVMTDNDGDDDDEYCCCCCYCCCWISHISVTPSITRILSHLQLKKLFHDKNEECLLNPEQGGYWTGTIGLLLHSEFISENNQMTHVSIVDQLLRQQCNACATAIFSYKSFQATIIWQKLSLTTDEYSGGISCLLHTTAQGVWLTF